MSDQLTTPKGDPLADLSAKVLPLLPGVRGEAVFSPDYRHRYALWRRLAPDDAPFALFIGMNPSVASAEGDDRTLRRMQEFGKREGYQNICVANAFAVRGQKPDIIKKVVDPVGPDNDATIRELHARSAITVACWGDPGGWFYRDHNLRRLLAGKPVYCLAYTEKGLAGHPLYLPGDAPLLPYPRPVA